MKMLTKAIIASLALSAAYAHAEVRLLVDDNIKVTAVNGQEVHRGALQPLQREFKLEAGRHVVTARYHRIFDLTRGDHDYLKSGNITVTADLQDNQTYQLVMPNQPNNYSAAKEYVKSPTLAVAHNGQVIAQESIVEDRTGVLSSITQSIGGMFGRNNAVTSNQKTMAALNRAPTTTVTAPSAPTQAPVARDNLDGFMQLWLNSSEEEREKIRQWIGK